MFGVRSVGWITFSVRGNQQGGLGSRGIRLSVVEKASLRAAWEQIGEGLGSRGIRLSVVESPGLRGVERA